MAVNESQFEMMEMMKEGKSFEELKKNEEFKTIVGFLMKLGKNKGFFIDHNTRDFIS